MTGVATTQTMTSTMSNNTSMNEDSVTRNMTVAIAVGVSVGTVAFAVLVLFGLLNGFRYILRELKGNLKVYDHRHVFYSYLVIIIYQLQIFSIRKRI